MTKKKPKKSKSGRLADDIPGMFSFSLVCLELRLVLYFQLGSGEISTDELALKLPISG